VGFEDLMTSTKAAGNGAGNAGVLDTVGLYCPVPIIKTATKIREMRAGEILEVLSDDRVILVDMPAWCKSSGHQYLGHREEAGELHLFVRKVQRGDRGAKR
jgi:tRNA 2-thiouridine synthesizing protein A